MKKIVFTEEFCSPENLFPFTLTRQIQDIRIGILTIREKWELSLGAPSFDKQEDDYKDLDKSIKFNQSEIGDAIIYLIHGNILPSPQLVKKVSKLKPGECISINEKENIVYCFSKNEVVNSEKIKINNAIYYDDEILKISYPWDIIGLNAKAIQLDCELLQSKRKHIKASKSNTIINESNIFIEKGAVVEHCFLNASDGPIYIGKGAIVMEGSLLRGPIAVSNNAVVKMGTRIYGATTIGPFCTAGGEIKNSIFFGFSNKGHDGYIGDAIVGEWCNLGAGTSCSNVKNNASDIRIYTPKGLINVGKKCGVLMGDYSRTSINTSINTGTVIGVSSNVFGNGLTPKFIPSFSWGMDGIERYDFKKALQDIENWKVMKNQSLTENEQLILKHIFDHY